MHPPLFPPASLLYTGNRYVPIPLSPRLSDIILKGRQHEIFEVFFYRTVPPGPIRRSLEQFLIFAIQDPDPDGDLTQGT